MEWAVSKDGWGGAGGLALTYEDTIGDLILSSTGGLIGSLLGFWWLGRKAPPENDAGDSRSGECPSITLGQSGFGAEVASVTAMQGAVV